MKSEGLWRLICIYRTYERLQLRYVLKYYVKSLLMSFLLLIQVIKLRSLNILIHASTARVFWQSCHKEMYNNRQMW